MIQPAGLSQDRFYAIIYGQCAKASLPSTTPGAAFWSPPWVMSILALITYRNMRMVLTSIERVFRREVGSDFEFWRRQARLMKAVELLVTGHSVKEVGFALGYRQPTGFVEMFRGILGTTPGSWIKSLQRLN